MYAGCATEIHWQWCRLARLQSASLHPANCNTVCYALEVALPAGGGLPFLQAGAYGLFALYLSLTVVTTFLDVVISSFFLSKFDCGTDCRRCVVVSQKVV